MKTAQYLFLLLLTTGTAYAQKNSNEIALVKDISLDRLEGEQYMFSAEIRSLPADSNSKAGLFVLQVGKNDYDFLRSGPMQYTTSSTKAAFQKITLQGNIDPKAKKIWLYLLASGNGDFYFDNLELNILHNNVWKQVPIKNHHFEETNNTASVLKTFKNSKSVTGNSNITASVDRISDAQGNVLHFLSRNNIVSNVIRYGQNAAAGNYIQTRDHTNIYYETYGAGEPLLLLHGNGGSIQSFKGEIPELAKHFKVIAVDTRAQGKSTDSSTADFSYELFADDMKTLIDQLQLAKVNIIGWSDGANTALLLAMQHPDRISKMVLMGANLNPSAEAISSKIIKEVKSGIAELQNSADPKEKTTLRLIEMLLKEPNIPVEDLAKIKAKTLVMAGQKDLVLEKHTRLIADHIPHARLKIVKGATHFFPEEDPALFTKLALGFLLE
ncbi:MAG: alpha/beta hydrolase [Ferruginibacter sp.]